MMKMKMMMMMMMMITGSLQQSGDREADTEPRIRCSSHISPSACSLTCELLGGGSDDEDAEEEEDGIEGMRLCYSSWRDRPWCLEEPGGTISSGKLRPVMELQLTVHLRRGGNISTTLTLNEIVKPRTPQVWNVSFDQDLNQAVIRFQTPDNKDYLKVETQLFQLHICTAGSSTIQNVSSKDFLEIDMDHLQKHTEYQVRVRAIPQRLKGSWSEWSDTFSFITPRGPGHLSRSSGPPENQVLDQTYILVACLVSLLVVSSAVVCWKNKIFAYLWPSIPHPKQTLVQICKPNKGLLLNFKPEEFSALKVDLLETPEEETEASIRPAAADGVQSGNPTSTQTSSTQTSSTQTSTQTSNQTSNQSSSSQISTQTSTQTSTSQTSSQSSSSQTSSQTSSTQTSSSQTSSQTSSTQTSSTQTSSNQTSTSQTSSTQTSSQTSSQSSNQTSTSQSSSQTASTQTSSTQSSTSVSTEDLELAALLSSSSGEDVLQSSSPSPVLQPMETPASPDRIGAGHQVEVEVLGGQQEEAYVTMSSFYQIK